MSGDTFDFFQGNRETLTGTLHDPAATPGDVLTVQADKSIAAAPGGGSAGDYASIALTGIPGVVPGANVPFDTVVSDAAGYYDAPNKQFVIPAGKGGIFLVGVTADESSDGAPTACIAVLAFTAAFNVDFGLALYDAPVEYAGGITTMIALTDGDTINLNLVPNGGATAMSVAANLWLQRLGTT